MEGINTNEAVVAGVAECAFIVCLDSGVMWLMHFVVAMKTFSQKITLLNCYKFGNLIP